MLIIFLGFLYMGVSSYLLIEDLSFRGVKTEGTVKESNRHVFSGKTSSSIIHFYRISYRDSQGQEYEIGHNDKQLLKGSVTVLYDYDHPEKAIVSEENAKHGADYILMLMGLLSAITTIIIYFIFRKLFATRAEAI
jgi:hypothetical protein